MIKNSIRKIEEMIKDLIFRSRLIANDYCFEYAECVPGYVALLDVGNDHYGLFKFSSIRDTREHHEDPDKPPAVILIKTNQPFALEAAIQFLCRHQVRDADGALSLNRSQLLMIRSIVQNSD